ncbi:MAG: serine protease, partial [Planctomycetaceae bacterium]|nr:serine protease [Planctomycetaceae bacterium]
ASMQWPVPDASREIPSPRLLADVPVSVGGSEFATITIAPVEEKVWEVTAGEKFTIPLVHTRRCEFSGANISLKTYGAGFERVAAFDAPLAGDASEVVIDLAKLKTPPGEYVIAFYGSAVAKYRYNIGAVSLAETALKEAKQAAAKMASKAKTLAEAAKAAPKDQQAASNKAAQDAATKHKSATAAALAAERQLKSVTAKAKSKDIVDIIVSKPITIRVKPAKTAEKK